MKKLPLFIIICLCASYANAADVTLAWDANSETELAGYKIYYRTGGQDPPYDGTGITEGDSPIDIPLSALTDQNSPQITLNGLAVGNYSFAATAYDDSGNESDYSNVVSYQVFAAPSAPIELTAEYDSNQISLTWSQAGEIPVDYWGVFYREQGQTDWIELDRVTGETILTKPLTIVAEGEDKTIEFTVVAFGSGGNSADSNVVTVRIDRKPPAPPVLKTVTIPVE